MATPRPMYGLPAAPKDGIRVKKVAQTSGLLSPPQISARTGRKEAEPPAIAMKLFPSSRVPQPSTRRPSIPQPVRPTSNQQAQSRGSSSTSASTRSGTTTRGSGSSSSARSIDAPLKPAPNVLRRKRPTPAVNPNARHESPRRGSSSTSSLPRSRGSLEPPLAVQLDRGLTTSPTELKFAEAVEIQKPSARSPTLYPELDRYREPRRPSTAPSEREALTFEVPFRLATHDLPPPTPGSILFSGTSGSPSTRFSGSPGFGPYSRDTTPTSICSQSPGVIAPLRINQAKSRLNTTPESRPPVTRRRAGSFPNETDSINIDPQGLAAVRESLTSSSSNSTVREFDRGIREKKSKRLPPPPPSPPPRKSSQNFRLNPEEGSPLRPTRKASRPPVSSPSLSVAAQFTPAQAPPSPSIPPSRPSRDGAPDIHSQLFNPVPVIHSNLSTHSLAYERRGSEPAIQGSQTRVANPPYLQAERNASTSRLPIGEPSTHQNAFTIDSKKATTKAESSRSARTPSPNVTSTFNTRFPFFSRKKTTVDAAAVEKKEKEKEKKKGVRKGPVAGTGHEGYGRLGAVRRRSGSGSATNTTQRSSEESLVSDPFLAERVNPVIIAGGEIVENRNASSDLSKIENLGDDQPKPVADTSRQVSRNTLWPSAMPRTQLMPGSRQPSESSDSEDVPMKQTLAFRRSVQRLRSDPDSPLRLPQPINTTGSSPSPMTSFDMSIMSEESHTELQRELDWKSAHPAPKKLTKRPRSPRKWNLFGRSTQPDLAKSDKVNATVSAKPSQKKNMAFYMMDSSEQDDSEPMDVHEVLRRANVFGYSPSPEEPSVKQTQSLAPPETLPLPKAKPQQPAPPVTKVGSSTERPRSRVAPKPVEKLKPTEKPKPAAPAAPAAMTLSSGRPSRLPQVGRIPKVVSKRPEHVSSPKSFSRPFRASVQLPPRGLDVYDANSIAKGLTPPKPLSPVPDLTNEGSTIGSGTNKSSSRGSIPRISSDLSRVEREFLAFSPRKNSLGTIGTSSSSCSGLYSFAGATAVIPSPDDPPAEDEVWDEYDDLLGEEAAKDPASASSSKGVPFHLETYHSKLAKEMSLESPTIALDNKKVSTSSKATTRSSHHSTDMTERIRAAFQPHPSTSTTFSVSEFVSGYGKRNNSADISRRADDSRRSSRSDRRKRYSDASSNSEDGSPLAQVNLRVGSMTVSKWLTFGHVLFSDVRHELVPMEGSLKRPSILVLDGLGNDDWSFYAAETYPAANFFNLSPRAPLPTELQTSPSSFPLSPPNHHQVQYASHLEKFPFAPQSFTALVYRFPVAAPESYYRNILTEARRVLKPGGYIELSILDVDLNNMGNRGRRAVRRLKERVNETSPDTNLSSTADLIVRLLGKVGFSAIKAARVGVPVASSVTSSLGNNPGESGKKKNQPSLAEMMRDNSPLADEGITKMVSRVGRWWYTRCYEGTEETPGVRSIWNDKTFLHECEDLGTSLKLMVCCARAPDRITSF